MIHLDTSFLIRALLAGSREDECLRRFLSDGREVAISAIGWGEFLCGPVDREAIDFALEVVSDVLPFLAEDALRAAELFNASGRRRGSLGDCMIAAVALRLDAELATSDPGDFRRFAGAGLRLYLEAGAG